MTQKHVVLIDPYLDPQSNDSFGFRSANRKLQLRSRSISFNITFGKKNMHRYLVMASFIALGISLLIVMIGSFLRKSAFVGKVTGGYFQFIVGKLGIYGCWTLCIIKAIDPAFGFFETPVWLSWLASVLLTISGVFFIIAFFTLSKAAKMGLPSEKTTLRTKGIYGISRNPMYLTLHLICISSVLYFPDPFNLVLALAGIIVHHRMAIEEEGFLKERFGEEWVAYKGRVRRYL